MPPRYYRFDTFVVDTRTRQLRRGDATVRLTGKGFDTLCFLVEHRDRVVDKAELFAAIWSGRVVDDNNLNQAITAVRRALGTKAGDPRFVVTVPGQGYRFVADARSDDGVGPVTLAVLPFRSLSSGVRDELLELGLAETLMTRLSRSAMLRVRSLGSSQRASSGEPDPAAAGHQLNAAYVVHGSTQRAGDDVRVNAHLMSVTTGETVWADTFDAHIERVFTVQDGIVSSVMSALELPAIPRSPVPRTPDDGEDPQAYRAYLRGHYLLQRPTRTTLSEALTAFRRALDLDPAYVRAYVGLALAYRGLVHADCDPREMFPLGKAAVNQALRIDPDSPDALMARGRIEHLYDWNWEAAAASFERAIELNPSQVDGHFAYAHLLVDIGRTDEGLLHAGQARELDPLSPLINTLEAGFLTAARQHERARRQLERALHLQPDFWIALMVRGGMALDRGAASDGVADLSVAAERSDRTSQVLAVLAAAQVAAGQRDAANAIRRELEARRAAEYVPATSLAAVYNALGHEKKALTCLELAYEERDIRLAFLKVDARWNNLRAHPRFVALGRRLGLPGERAYGRY